MATRRIKEITNTATTFASDDFIALDGTTQGTRKMDKDDLIAEVSAGVSGDYLEEANNLSDVASLDTSKLNMEIPDVGSSANEVSLNGQLGTMAFQDSAGVSVGQLEVTDKVKGPLGIDGSPGSYAYSGADDLVVGDASGSRGITISTGSSDTGALYFGDAATTGLESYRGMVRYSHSSDKLELGTLSQVRATIDSSGNVGIGTASPDQLIHASSSTGASLRLERDSVTITSGQSYGAVEWEGQDASGGGAASGVRAKIETEATGSSGDVALKFYTAAANDVATERVTISSSGNVSVPSGQVQVVSGAASAPSYAFDGDTDTGISRPTTNAINFVTGGTERWRINASGNLVANGTAIDFGSGATLDDYETGTANVAFVSGGGSVTINPSNNTIRYIKVGKLVHIHGEIAVSSVSSPSGDLQITGLPFVSANVGGYNRSTVALHPSTLTAATELAGFVENNSSYIVVRVSGGTTSGGTAASVIRANTAFVIGGTYEAA